MSILKNLEKKIWRTLIFFVILPPMPIIIALVVASKIVENYSILYTTLLILLPIIAFFTWLKIWLWNSVYIKPLKRIAKHIKNLKNMGYQIDDSSYDILEENAIVVTIKDYSAIPKNHNYKVAAIKIKGATAFIGIVNENKQVYDLTKLS
ncbi:hypothetical protein QPL79_02015 [Ignisphaera sp. 4213-co]|uniref:DUF2208 domain-containing protein n=1 Tax=Ignisphaera cupida TaxID=3050454 RepID=A0ABD4Z5G2_9CREN|nr:hypothetical protein [Ignisphaera sp. 4213-co]MDK6028140.1 hypothetical protein [Ignisphaera sp. 4213-co]